jgi:hypothetical protein
MHPSSLVPHRVGYENGPQVPDPRCPAWQQYTEAFEAHWKGILQHQLARGGREWATATPEYGPPSYQHVLPFSQQQPTADVAEINDWTAERLRSLV